MDYSGYANLAFGGVAVFAGILTAIAGAALVRSRSPRMALVASGFALITLQGIVVGLGLFQGGWDPFVLLLVTAAFEAAVLVVLFLATLVR